MPTLVAEFDTKQFEQGVLRIRKGLDTVESEAKQTGRGVDNAFAGGRGIANTERATGRLNTSMRSAATGAGLLRTGLLGIVSGFTLNEAVGTLAEFDNSMQRAKGATETTGKEFETLRDLALDLGRTTTFSSQQAAEGIVFLGRAAFETEEIVATLPVALQLAQGASVDLARSADALSNIMSGFGKEADQAREVSDVLVTTINGANTDFNQLADAIAKVAPIASSTGTSLEEISASIGVLGDNALQGAEAGTGLRTVILSLVKPSTDALKTIESLGLTLEDINPEKVGLPEAFRRLRDAQASVADITAIFGREAAAAASILVNNADNVGNLTDKLEESDGATEKLAGTLKEGLQPAIKGAGSALEGFIITLGDQGITDALEAGFENAAETLNNLSDRIRETDDVAGSFAETVGEEVFDAINKFSGGLLDDAKPALEAVDQFFIDGARTVVEYLAEVLKIQPAFGGVEAVTGQVADAISNTFARAVQRAKEELSDLLDLLPDSVRSFIGLGDEIDNASDALEGLGDAAGDVERDVDDLIDTNEDLFGTLEDNTTAANDTANSLFALGLASQTASDDFSDLGIVFEDTSARAASSVRSLNDSVLDAVDDIRDNLELVGIDIENIFGQRATQALDGFFGLVRSNTGVANDLFGEFLGLFGGGTADAAEQATTGYFGFQQTVETSLPDLTEGVQGLNVGFGELTTTLGNLGAAAGALGALGQTTAALTSALGFSDSAALGAGIGNVIFPGLGGIAGGFLGSAIGAGGNERRGNERDAAEEIRQFFAAGGSATTGDLFGQLDSEFAANVINRQIREFDLLRDAFASVTTEIGELNISAEFVLRALGDQAGTTAGVIADVFGVSAIDVAAAINSLPPEVRGSFESLAANGDQVAELLAERFGLSVDQVKALLDDLAIQGAQAISNLDNSSDSAALSIANAFGLSVDQVRQFFLTLDPAALESFSSIRANSDDLAASIAGAFGLSIDEVKAILGDLGVVAQQELDAVAINADTASQSITAGFSQTGLDISAILAEISAQGTESFGLIAQGADGSFSLVDEAAQERLANIVTAFGGTQADVLAILQILGENGVTTFDQIAQGADGSFEVIDASARERLQGIIDQFGATGEATGVVLETIANDGVESFNTVADGADGAFLRIGDVSQETLTQIEAEFADSEGTITDLLQILANNGAISFDQLAGDGTTSARGIQDAFVAAGASSGSALRLFQSDGQSAFAAVESSGVGAASGVQAAFVSASNTIRGTISSIIGEAARARDAVNSIPSPRPLAPQPVPGAAFGGIITRPVTLTSASPFGQGGFAFGGLLPGLTGISGGSGLFTAQAGEGGRPEAIVPLENTSRGLGINAVGLGGQQIMQVIIIEGVDRRETDEIKQRIASTSASIPTIARGAAVDVLRGLF